METRKKVLYCFCKIFIKDNSTKEENCWFSKSWLKQIFWIHAYISYQPIKTGVWQHITNQNSCDVTAVFPYSHLNTAIDQWECACYPNYFIKIFIKDNSTKEENCWFSKSWLKQIFWIHAYISYQPIKTGVWQHITNQNSCDVTAVFPYSHLNTAIDQWECACYPNYFIKSRRLLHDW